jgi:hypothetical protein
MHQATEIRIIHMQKRFLRNLTTPLAVIGQTLIGYRRMD